MGYTIPGYPAYPFSWVDPPKSITVWDESTGERIEYAPAPGRVLPVALDDGAFPPVRAHAEDAGLDLMTMHDVTIPAHGTAVVHTGTHVQIPEGWFGKLESKSGLNVNHGVFCTGGVIDAGFTGAIRFRLANCSDEDYTVHAGEKAVQMVLVPCLCAGIEIVDEVGGIGARGDAGFGSSGR